MHLAFQSRDLHNTAHNTRYHVSLLGNVCLCAQSGRNIFLASEEFPFIVRTRLRQKKHKLLAQISYPKQFATAKVTSTGSLIAALQAREVEVSQGCPFNRTG
jgi:hypothetical protein